jgi:TolA-binding protein
MFLYYEFFCRLEAGKRASKSGESEILQILQDKEVDLTSLEQQCRKLGTQVEQLQNNAAVYKELLQVRCFGL